MSQGFDQIGRTVDSILSPDTSLPAPPHVGLTHGVPIVGGAQGVPVHSSPNAKAPFLLDSGARVMLRGLSSGELNGKEGCVEGYDLASARYIVQLDAGGIKLKVKRGNGSCAST